jgi:hypothetical protein
LVDAVDGQGVGSQSDCGQSDLAGFRVQAASGGELQLSPDPQFTDKVRDIVGFYLNPPDAAVVLCVDEKSQIQARDRTAPVLALLAGVPERRTSDAPTTTCAPAPPTSTPLSTWPPAT